MLSAQAYTFGKKARLAVSLAWVGGFVDAVGLLELTVYTSNMTGNTATLGQRLAEGHWGNVAYVYFLVTMFLVGAMVAGFIIESGRRARRRYVYSVALGIEALLLTLSVLYVETGGQNVFLRGMLPCLAMGLQNATITRISGSVVRTTHVTGIITDIGLESVQFLYWLYEKSLRRRLLKKPSRAAAKTLRFARITRRHPTFQRLLLLGGIWSLFVVGAALGALAWRSVGMNALLLPAAFLAVMIVLERLTPMASLEAVDRAARARLFLQYGIEPDLVPLSVGIYEVAGSGSNRSARAAQRRRAGRAGGGESGGLHARHDAEIDPTFDTHPDPHPDSDLDTHPPGQAVRAPASAPNHTRTDAFTSHDHNAYRGRRVRTPDLGELPTLISPRESLVILVLGPDIHLDPNALAGLQRTLDTLRQGPRPRDLVLCVRTTQQFEAVRLSPFGHSLGPASLCSDLEFALARALELAGETATV